MELSARRKLFDDVFDIFSMLVGSNVALYDARERLTRFSPAIVEELALPGEYIPDGVYNWMNYIHPADKNAYERVMEEMLGLKRMTYDLNYRVRKKDGSYTEYRMVGGVIRDLDGSPGIVGGLMLEASAEKLTDRVTGLPNQEQFFEDLVLQLSQGNQKGLLLLGFGRLSHINEVYGYGYGSRVLYQVAREVEKVVRGIGRVYRMEGSRFLILTDTDFRETEILYETIREALKSGIVEEDIRHNLLTYGGYLSLSESAREQERTIYDCLLQACDESRYFSRGDLISYHGSRLKDEGETVSLKRSVELIHALRESMLRDFEGFYLLYQPVFSASGKELKGAEALLRWKNDRFGRVLPGAFLPEIGQDKLFAALGEWILKKVMLDGREFIRKKRDFMLMVNISPGQLQPSYFADDVAELARQADFPPGNLCLEFTGECRVRLDPETMETLAQQLHEKGLRVGIDDFGRGNNWLLTFRGMRPDFVKFHRDLVTSMESSQKDRKILRHLTELVDDCGVEVFLKGVETEGMKNALSACPVTGMQGYLFSAPVFFDEIEELEEVN